CVLEQGVRTFLLICLCATACALAPGMRMDEGAAEARGRANTKNGEYRVEPITPSLLTKLADQGARESSRLVDPDGHASPAAYTVAPYDVLQVTVWDHPELTAPTGQFRSPEENGNPVNVDGTVYYPYVGILPVAGKTVAEIRNVLTTRLASVIQKPQLDVRIAAFRRKPAEV